jgi:hypothetical protein
MKLLKLLPTCFLALGLSLSIAACDDGDDGDNADTNNDSTTDNNTEETGDNETTGADDVVCATLCTNFVDLCIQTAMSTEFETYDECDAACQAWDQAGINCRNEQIIAGACDQAGNMGSTC